MNKNIDCWCDPWLFLQHELNSCIFLMSNVSLLKMVAVEWLKDVLVCLGTSMTGVQARGS